MKDLKALAPRERVRIVAKDRRGGIMMTLHPEILVKDGKKQFALLPYEEFMALKERLEDVEDLLQLRKAKKAEGRKRTVSLAHVKRQLDLK